jgi:hypothetical protein
MKERPLIIGMIEEKETEGTNLTSGDPGRQGKSTNPLIPQGLGSPNSTTMTMVHVFLGCRTYS